MAGNRKHGFRRGNANGRNGNHPSNWFCDGCQREHGYKVASWGTLDGKRLCSRQYEKAAQLRVQLTESGLAKIEGGSNAAIRN